MVSKLPLPVDLLFPEEMLKTNNLDKLGKEEHNRLKESRKKEIIKEITSQ